MTLRIGSSTSYTWPVKVKFPGDGKLDELEFTASFKRLPQARIDAIFNGADGEHITDEDLVREVLIGWAHVLDENGEPLPFTPEHVAAVMDIQGVRFAVARAWMESVLGGARKN